MLKSTEIVVEQLVIGLLFVAIVYLFLFGTPLPDISVSEDTFTKFAFSTLIVLAAYAAGIIVDRWADTSLQYLEKHRRLKAALDGMKYRDLKTKCKEEELDEKVDLLPEDEIRIRILERGEGPADYHDYLRTRLRITRAITFLLPALLVAIQMPADSRSLRVIVGSVVVLIYLGSVLLVLFQKKIWLHDSGDDSEPTEAKPKVPLPPRTDDIKSIAEYVGTGDDEKEIKLKAKWIGLAWPLWIGLLAIVSICALLALGHERDLALYCLCAVVLGTLITGAAWYRIAGTFFVYMSDYHRLVLQPGRNQ